MSPEQERCLLAWIVLACWGVCWLVMGWIAHSLWVHW